MELLGWSFFHGFCWLSPFFFQMENTGHGPAFGPKWMSSLRTMMLKAENTPLAAAFASVTFPVLGHHASRLT